MNTLQQIIKQHTMLSIPLNSIVKCYFQLRSWHRLFKLE